VIAETQSRELYLETFEEFDQASRQQPAWLRSIRRQAFARFAEAGFPTTHDEDWRFTNVAPIARTSFELARDGVAQVSAADLEPFLPRSFGAGPACQLVFVNGHFAPQLSPMAALPPGVKVGSLAEEIIRNPGELEPHLARYADIRRDAFCAFNTAFIEDGAYVRIRRGTVLERPIYLLFVSTARAPSMAHPRNLMVAEEDSQAAVAEDYISLAPRSGSGAQGAPAPEATSGLSAFARGSGAPSAGGPAAFFSNTVTELVAADNAVLSHYMILREDRQAFNVSTLRIQQGRAASVTSHSVLLGGALVRNNVHPVLAGNGGECLINGLFLGNDSQHMDNYMLVEHASPHCNSRQFYNGILDERAHGVFHGRIIVHKDAQKTDAKQTNRNLLLSDEAQIDTKPQLEIYADDVKCTHGATIGQVDENALFYTRSRGLEEAAARRLLLLAFANESLERMNPGPVRAHLESLLQEWLPRGGGPSAISSSVEAERRWEEVG